MPRYIVKLSGKYLIWSTIVDAPVTFGMSLSEFAKYYQCEYGNEGMYGLATRMGKVEDTGTSCGDSIKSLLELNRAGPNEGPLSIANIRKAWCDRIPIHVWNDKKRYEFDVNTGNWFQINSLNVFIVKIHHKYFDWDSNYAKPSTLGLTLDEFTKYYQEAYPHWLWRLPSQLQLVDETGVSCSLYASWRDVLSFNKTGPEETTLSINQFKKAYCDRLPIIKTVGNKRYQWNAGNMEWNQLLDE